MNVSTNDMLFMFFVLFFMLIITYLTTKLIAKFYGTSNLRKTKTLSILERIHLSKDSALLIVKVGEKVVLLGVTPQSISKISDLDDVILDSYKIEDSSLDQMTFTEALKKNISNFVKEENKDFDEK